MKTYLKSVFALTMICAVIGVALAYTNMLTSPVIEKNDQKAVEQSLKFVMPDGKDFSLVALENLELPETVSEIYKSSDGGYVVKLETSGYAPGMVIMCGVDKDGVVAGATCISCGETLGHEETYGEKLLDKTLENIESVDTVASATKTTSAYKNAVKDALLAAQILKGGE